MERSKGVKADLSHAEINKRFATDFKRSSRVKNTTKESTLGGVSKKKRKEMNKARYLGSEENCLRKGKNATGWKIGRKILQLEELSQILEVPPYRNSKAILISEN